MQFSELNHEYTQDGVRYQSVSEFLSQFEKPFAKEAIAEASAKKNGGTAEDLISKWDLNADISCTYGTAVHKAIEYWVRYGETTKVPHLAKVVEAFAKKHDRTTIKPEIIVYSTAHKLAGTIDQLHILGPKRVKITDVKTNGELDDTAKSYFLAPLNKLPKSKINKYRLQLSMYKAMLEMKGIEVDSISLEHWDGEEFKEIALEPINVEELLTTLKQ